MAPFFFGTKKNMIVLPKNKDSKLRFRSFGYGSKLVFFFAFPKIWSPFDLDYADTTLLNSRSKNNPDPMGSGHKRGPTS